ncbi:MAG: 1-deoxy-D-xylulose-5-phosphate reductoisomerase [Chlamydiales bacterium]|nr:1-deoxy-D-xylulose-5-phosphate reductoisomerase [Chlamydiales bacterium]
MPHKVVILGSTGSVGKNALKVASHLFSEIEVVGLSAGSNIDLLEKQALEHRVKIVAVQDREKAFILQKRAPHLQVLAGVEGISQLASLEEADKVVVALVGSCALLPTKAAIEAKKGIALANKEVLVAAGSYIISLAKRHGVSLIPIDSEHNAIFQCLQSPHPVPPSSIGRLILTSSGGPFRGWNREQLQKADLEMALQHPNFSMGSKITIDSSTMMNKGLEVIEAHFLFDLPIDQIEVLIHPQQIIHSMVEFIDGSVLAQMSRPDMLYPIQYAMTYPRRLSTREPPFDFLKNRRLDFESLDRKLFPCLDLAYAALKKGGTFACYMNAANEVLVGRFLKKQILWHQISSKLETLLSRYSGRAGSDLEEILEEDRLAREEAFSI